MSSLWAAFEILKKKQQPPELGGQTTVTRFKFDLIRQAVKEVVLPLLKLNFSGREKKGKGGLAVGEKQMIDMAGGVLLSFFFFFFPLKDEF